MKIVHQLIYVSLLLLPFQEIAACSFAYQYSIYPLGSSLGQLVAVQMELERYVNTPDNFMMQTRSTHQPFDATGETRWKGTIDIVQYNPTKVVWEHYQSIAEVDIADENYEEALLPYLQEGWQIAKDLPFFQAAQLVEMGICHYDTACTFFQKKVDTIENKAFCYLDNHPKQLQEIHFPEVVLQKFENKTREKFTDIEQVDMDTRLGFYRIWRPYGVRKYQLMDGSELVIYTLGWGQKGGGVVPIREEDWQTMLPPVEEFVEGKEVMFHGYRFDQIQVQ